MKKIASDRNYIKTASVGTLVPPTQEEVMKVFNAILKMDILLPDDWANPICPENIDLPECSEKKKYMLELANDALMGMYDVLTWDRKHKEKLFQLLGDKNLVAKILYNNFYSNHYNY